MMKQILLLILTMIGFSCGNKPETSTTVHLKIKLDTLMVDAGEEILYLDGHDFALAPDGKYLYNFNRYDHTLEKIDLEELRLLEKLPFEKEGPNGTVSPIYNLNMLDKNHVYLSDKWSLGKFNLNGTRTATYDLLNNGLEGEVLTEFEHLHSNIIVPGQPETVFVLVFNWKDKTYNLRKMDFGQNRITKFEFDKEGILPKFTFKVSALSKDPAVRPYVYLSSENGKLIISSNITNEIHIYDPIGDSLISKKNQFQLTADEKTANYRGEYASMDELMLDYQKVLEQVSFSPPVWDDKNEHFYRFSYRIEFAEEKEAGKVLPEAIDRNIHLSVYDKDFEILAEVPVPQLVKNPVRYFVREGDIWIFANIADELGFIRLELTI
ncbi:protein of unknown function [Cyclobacterium lianum]|uniref:DUF4221 domain-containing protein n=1 Tax=Cyclobacterium lianum TaxID=388280 RepID=A0A1M7I3G5_9BACT|nr:DUF4221 family protein [Cyclobacterium lianum]SHM35255.1 protein of unknown function [Cyclobacterium lianum]